MREQTKNPSDQNVKLATLMLRIGLAVVFLYAAISSIRNPDQWIMYVPSFTTRFMAAKTTLDAISVFQIVLAIVLLSGKFLRYAATLAAILFAVIIIFNLSSLLVTFRDIGLLFSAVALALLG